MRKHKERWQCPNHMTPKIRNWFVGFYGVCIVTGVMLRVGFGLFWIGTEILGVGLSGMAVVYGLRRDHVAWEAAQKDKEEDADHGEPTKSESANRDDVSV